MFFVFGLSLHTGGGEAGALIRLFYTLSCKSHRLLGYIVPNLFVYVLAGTSKGEAFTRHLSCMCVCMSFVVPFSRSFPFVLRVAMYVCP